MTSAQLPKADSNHTSSGGSSGSSIGGNSAAKRLYAYAVRLPAAGVHPAHVQLADRMLHVCKLVSPTPSASRITSRDADASVGRWVRRAADCLPLVRVQCAACRHACDAASVFVLQCNAASEVAYGAPLRIDAHVHAPEVPLEAWRYVCDTCYRQATVSSIPTPTPASKSLAPSTSTQAPMLTSTTSTSTSASDSASTVSNASAAEVRIITMPLDATTGGALARASGIDVSLYTVTMNAKFAGECLLCTRPICIGDAIRWCQRGAGALHHECWRAQYEHGTMARLASLQMPTLQVLRDDVTDVGSRAP